MSHSFQKYAGRGLSGLANLGNTCYVNSCLQVLSHTYELNEVLDHHDYGKHLNRIPDAIVLLEWNKLRQLLWKTNCTVGPYGFIGSMQKVAALKQRELFTGFMQNDVSEFLLFMIDCFHMAMARKVTMQISGEPKTSQDSLAMQCYNTFQRMYSKEYSGLLDVFFGLQVSQLVDLQTQDILNQTPEPFCTLNLPLPADLQQPTLYDCLDAYCVNEALVGSNGWYNEKTKSLQDVQRKFVFWKLPNILIIDVKRWDQGKSRQKIQKLVQAPLTGFDLRKYVVGYNSDKERSIYELYGVCNHSGGVLGGHYTANIKNANGKWYNCNDTSVQEISIQQVVTPYAYCFFFRRQSEA
jgi:ubiquitin carboxyl-terminal hydrolase 8